MELQRFLSNCNRVLKITKKPNKQEFLDLVKITGLGLIVIGLLGFAVQVVTNLIG
ncbi:MAG: protein translocase SEC61 complex subunit gamma [Candidatus Woesearchaeota archaeon]